MPRAKAVIDYSLVEKLSRLQCNNDEIAMVLGTCSRTLERNKKYREIHQKGLDNGKTGLRRLQWKVAEGGSLIKRTVRTNSRTGEHVTEEVLSEPNATMCIWLGKQYLGQRDKQDIDAKVEAKVTLTADEALVSKLEALAATNAVGVPVNVHRN